MVGDLGLHYIFLVCAAQNWQSLENYSTLQNVGDHPTYMILLEETY